VEIGRVVVLQEGPVAGKIAAVVDVIDQNRVNNLLIKIIQKLTAQTQI
jgi:ribosomal protein L14E/L6E/L27E